MGSCILALTGTRRRWHGQLQPPAQRFWKLSLFSANPAPTQNAAFHPSRMATMEPSARLWYPNMVCISARGRELGHTVLAARPPSPSAAQDCLKRVAGQKGTAATGFAAWLLGAQALGVHRHTHRQELGDAHDIAREVCRGMEQCSAVS